MVEREEVRAGEFRHDDGGRLFSDIRHQAEVTYRGAAVRPEDTQKIVIGSSAMSKLLLLLLSAIATIIAWLGSAMVSKVDNLTTTFGTYTVVMERRVSMLEQSEQYQDVQLLQLQQQDRQQQQERQQSPRR